jgi:hypothetical protein
LIQAFSLQLGSLGLALAIALVIARQFAKAALVIAASASFWVPVAPFLLASAEVRSSGATLRLVLLETSNEKAVAYVLSVRPDIVVIADPSSPGHDRRADLAPAYPVQVGNAGGLVILARPGIDLSAVPGSDGELDMVRAHVALERSAFDLTVAHLDRPWPLGAGSSLAPSPAPQLAKRVGGGSERMIIVGDFNRPPWTSEMKDLQDSLGVSAAAAPGTWPSWLPRPLRLPLDLVLVGKGLAAGTVELGPDVGSDHLPIVADIALQP